MNKIQRFILLVAATLVAICVSYVPRGYIYRNSWNYSGHYFILDYWHFDEPIDFGSVILRVGGILIVCGLLVLAFYKPRNP